VEPPHRDRQTYVPPMASCFACHGLVHGPSGELASGECATCHPADAELRPASHVETWAAEPHALASEGDANPCMLCHTATSDCDACHVAERLDVGPMPPVYLSSVPLPPALPEVTVDLDAPVSMSQCVFCHGGVEGFAVPGLIFSHEPHLERAYRCESCHLRFPHDIDGTERIAMRTCYPCHGLTHADKGAVAPGECEACHTPDFELVPADHDRAFLLGEHREQALEDAAYCTQCHTGGSCVDCHNGGTELADGSVGEPVIPVDHTKPQWSSQHGPIFSAGQGLCGACHASASCTGCHETTMPHPTAWTATHAQVGGLEIRDCEVCHDDRESCQACHHAEVAATELILENCVRCHEEMKTVPPTDIQVAGLAEHAVHFGVAETKGKPYRCVECHVGFGRVGVRVTSQATGPHDMRICYDCHGAVDIQNRFIAPWPGSELCRRCHSDLNI